MSEPKAQLDALERKLRELRQSYDRYFAGIERLPPQAARDAFNKTLQSAQTWIGRSTALRFRLQSIRATYLTHSQRWDKCVRQIEDGTFARDKRRAHKNIQARAQPSAKANTDASTNAQANPAVERLHAAYIEAQGRAGQKPVSLDKMQQVVAKQAAALKKQYGCQSVQFRVAVKDGKPFLKAIPK